MSCFANGNLLLTLSRFIRQNNAKWIFKIVILVSAVMLGAIYIGFKTFIWSCILTHILFSLSTGKNVDPYIIKLSSLSNTREFDDEPNGTLCSWFGHILFLQYEINAIGHGWLLAMDHVCKNKMSCLYVLKKSTKHSRPSKTLLVKWQSIPFIFVFYPLFFTSWRYLNTAVAVKGYYKCWKLMYINRFDLPRL